MTRRLILGVSLIAVAALSGGAANASMCIDGHPDVPTEYAHAAYVVEARVIRIAHHVGGAEPHDRITVQVLHAYKGRPTRLISFDNPRDSAAMVAKQSGVYLIFFGRYPHSRELYVDTCGSSGPIAQSEKALPIVQRLASAR